MRGACEVWKVARVKLKNTFSKKLCSEKELKGAFGLRDFFKIKDVRARLYADRNDLVERRK